MHDHPDRVPIDRCLHGWLCRIDARRLNLGVYRSVIKGFFGKRSKVGYRYLFTEFHGDTCPPYGTAKALGPVCECPVQLLVEYSKSAKGEPIENQKLIDWIDDQVKRLGMVLESDS